MSNQTKNVHALGAELKSLANQLKTERERNYEVVAECSDLRDENDRLKAENKALQAQIKKPKTVKLSIETLSTPKVTWTIPKHFKTNSAGSARITTDLASFKCEEKKSNLASSERRASNEKSGIELVTNSERLNFSLTEQNISRSQLEIKEFLKETKVELDPPLFKQFIQKVKELVGSNDNSVQVLQSIRCMLGEKHKGLYDRLVLVLSIK